ncbi:MAG: acetyl-CoA carboxylase biotin carboxylase subunit [Ignavibacteriaceae bacterium]|nr:acetyl-CoA carboxylase biotin carboxylase subunit [Ignavibacteriaceae bacterium]MCW8812736.1 acetyl-CoA carboxylase biotin carboxylase subunit [Chlorobium sp.]
MFKKILVANRGEIAVRVIRSCRELGIKSAAIYSEADKTSLHTRLADESYYIGSAPAHDSYLNKEKILKLALDIGADAIHPGYGFFAENSEFIRECEKNKITFIGPSSKSVALMGSKTEARKLMANNKVPIVPGTTESIKSVNNGLKIAQEVGYPVLLKASAGGGGKGMRRINSSKEFESAFEATKREALKAFANDDIYIEKFILNPRHIEVQIFGDKHGNYVHLFERECSIQRRHQKIIEEAPSSFVDEITRQKITAAAVNAARACNYLNAGTVEFLMDADKKFYFLEMNTRLQVEHPVTEMITGLDLVKEQISIAAGNKLSFNQNDLKINGHALECRIYAEDSFNNFLPSTGLILSYSHPSGPGVRVDSGFDNGSQITVHYDPLISKLVCWSDTRQSAIDRMLRALSEYIIGGLITNISFLKIIVDNPSFRNGNFNINFLNDDFMKSINELENNKEIQEIEKISAIFAAILKSNSSVNNLRSNHTETVNLWQEQLYE